ncbi:agmatine deiminase [Vibrio sp. S4M6]|uniref:agmatine deiminase n=1 Tax=Vibrio sinus TaxID=2946865 RepID=UPI00202A74F9|nr:agmatine deiminase [Vibrio sinus]MCL9781288.1 agmatine deiminase [Vibrio sinus]
MKLTSTPKQDGFTFPAEFSPVSDVWLAWPERKDNWRDNALPAQQNFAQIANAIAKVVSVYVAVSKAQYAHALTLLDDTVNVVLMSYNDAWMRDIGPTVVTNKLGQKRGVSWQFNAWGGVFNGLYDDWSDDDRVAQSVCEYSGIDYYQAPFVLEGGAIHTDGEGTLYTTKECLLSPGRNPQLSMTQIEEGLKDYLGIEKVIWLTHGLYSDETDGHIDNLIHVIAPAKVVLSWTDDEHDPQYCRSRQTLQELSEQTDAKGRRIEVIKLPLPGPLKYRKEEVQSILAKSGMIRCEGERLSASYANFLMVNRHIFLPQFEEKNDRKAVEILSLALPEYEIISLPSREVLLGGGNIHCITQHIPA